ncbi:MAG: hypothetical protein OHK0015_05680 [Chloroflexi bacterium OHK40]
MALEGTLQDMSLSDLFQIFRMGPKTGVLVLSGDNGRGVIYVAEGRPIDAVVLNPDRSTRSTHEEAVIQMLLWDNASFIFRHEPAVVQRPVRINRDAEWLVLESMRRRADPTLVLPYHRITLDTRLQLAPLPSSVESGVSLDVHQWRILSQVSCCSDLRAICEATGMDPALAMRTVAELLAIGLIEVVTPPPASPLVRTERTPGLRQSAALEPALAGAGAAGRIERPLVGRGLIDAIMRRVRGM